MPTESAAAKAAKARYDEGSDTDVLEESDDNVLEPLVSEGEDGEIFP